MLVEAGHGREPALGQAQDLTDGVILRGTGQPVAALSAPSALKEPCLGQGTGDLLQILLRNVLPGGYIL